MKTYLLLNNHIPYKLPGISQIIEMTYTWYDCHLIWYWRDSGYKPIIWYSVIDFLAIMAPTESKYQFQMCDYGHIKWQSYQVYVIYIILGNFRQFIRNMIVKYVFKWFYISFDAILSLLGPWYQIQSVYFDYIMWSL